MSEHFENLEVNLRIGHTSQALLGIEFENVGKSKTTLCLCLYVLFLEYKSLFINKEAYKCFPHWTPEQA